MEASLRIETERQSFKAEMAEERKLLAEERREAERQALELQRQRMEMTAAAPTKPPVPMPKRGTPAQATQLAS